MDEETGQFWDLSKLTVVAGTNRVEGPLMDNSPVKASINKVFIPKEYQPIDPKTNTHKSKEDILADIAVIQLNQNLWKFLKPTKISTIKLPKFNPQKQYNGEAKVIGFGAWAALPIFSFDNTYKFEFKIDGLLRHANVDLLDKETCNKRLNPRSTNTRVICGRIKPNPGDEDGPLQRGTCQGDSGGPLVKGNTVIGVASFGSKYCDDKKQPSIYTKVSAYIPFIMNAVKNLETVNMNVWPKNRPSVSKV
ncbi:glandular kallikrein-3, submandibular-like [Trichogramma pretiosum]|uniref:glandular kallikrein-3, submandibular-like n=1 Tax=Trichogramma pretiosum TaxID=7493 RepID=UPI000C71BA8F|nr:glandular kallikrein-3, submandibular-like [Trichogramma pretiosum]